MARRQRRKNGRFVKAGAVTRRRRRRIRRNPSTAGTRLSRKSSRRARRRYTNLTAHRSGYYPNPRRRRRHAVTRRHRRSYRRNPGLGLGFILDGLKEGSAVFAGQIANRKLANLVQQYVPGLKIVNADGTPNLLGVFGSRILSAVAVGFVAKKAAPGWSRLITAGAFADAIGATLANIPAAAPFIGATALIRRPGGVSGYPRLPGGNGLAGRGMSGYPRSAGMPANVGGM